MMDDVIFFVFINVMDVLCLDTPYVCLFLLVFLIKSIDISFGQLGTNYGTPGISIYEFIWCFIFIILLSIVI